MFYRQEEYAFIFSLDQVEPPKCSSDNSSSKEIEENELRLAAGCVDLTRVLYWLGKLREFSWKPLILYVLENNPVEQVSKAAKSAQPKRITVCIHFISHIYTTGYLCKARHCAVSRRQRANARSETE